MNIQDNSRQPENILGCIGVRIFDHKRLLFLHSLSHSLIFSHNLKIGP